MTPKQAAEALRALDNALSHLANWDEDSNVRLGWRWYRWREDGLIECPTQWETLALFRLRQELYVRASEPKP